ncbi:MAG: non-canonical purine NTP diphosphatase [Bacteroidetes bacterium]|nr:non-canonical purine NTP diphosphatase [Bacteroidota bacterium]MCB0842784.1 non-canonical purine NTP diphosphatase [Bacteroidota bacterium]
MKPKILFGTNNQNKLQEIRQILDEKYEVLSLKDLGKQMDVEETETTLEGNAILKATTYYHHTGIPCFADDTGLEVEALNGAPGVYSARYAGENCSYDDNVNKMLREMIGKENRKAQFRTVIAFYDGSQTLTFDGIVNGQIIQERRGTNGFGYDPIFLPEGYQETFAELSSEVKNSISHRGKAVRKFAEFILQA